MDPRRGRRASAACAGIIPGRLAREPRTRRLYAGRAGARARDPRDPVRGSRPPGACDERVHDPHAGTRGARYVLARAGGAVHRPGVAGDGDQPRGLLPPRPSSGGRPRPLPYARRGHPPFGAGQRSVAPPWGRVAPHLGPAVARPRGRTCTDRPRHERRPHRHLDGEPDPDLVRLAFRAGLARARGRPRVLGRGPRAGRRRPVGRAQGAQVPSDAEHPGAGAAALLDQEALTIGFGRRFATYKRADLIFRDLDRLQRLLVNPWRPVQIVFSGKAHPGDEPGKQVLQRVYAHTREARFEGRIAFIEDYDMHLGHNLVQGVDLWLNLPRPPLEACGTSGMKAALNGVPQLSTLDGWWAEGFTGENGWAIPLAPPDAEPEPSDMENLFHILENEVVPRYYDRLPGKSSAAWVHMMKGALAVTVERFTTRQMLQNYVTNYYVPAAAGEAPPGEPPP